MNKIEKGTQVRRRSKDAPFRGSYPYKIGTRMGKDLGIFAAWPTIRSLVIANGLMGWHKMRSLSMRICLLGACRVSCEDLPKLILLSRVRTFGEATRVRKIDPMGEIPREAVWLPFLTYRSG